MEGKPGVPGTGRTFFPREEPKRFCLAIVPGLEQLLDQQGLATHTLTFDSDQHLEDGLGAWLLDPFICSSSYCRLSEYISLLSFPFVSLVDLLRTGG